MWIRSPHHVPLRCGRLAQELEKFKKVAKSPLRTSVHMPANLQKVFVFFLVLHTPVGLHDRTYESPCEGTYGALPASGQQEV